MIDQTLGGTPLASESIAATITLSGLWTAGATGNVTSRVDDSASLVGATALGGIGIAIIRVDDATSLNGAAITGVVGSFILQAPHTLLGVNAATGAGFTATRVDDTVILTGVSAIGASAIAYETGGHGLLAVYATSGVGVTAPRADDTVVVSGATALGAVGVVYEPGGHGLFGVYANGVQGVSYEAGEHAITSVFAVAFAAVLLGPLGSVYALGYLGTTSDNVTILNPGAMALGHAGAVAAGTAPGIVGVVAIIYVDATANQSASLPLGAFASGQVTKPLPRLDFVRCEGFDHQSSIGDLNNGILTQYGVTSVVVSDTQTPFGVGNALVVTVGAPGGYVVYQNGVPTAMALVCGVMTQSTASISAGTDIGFVNNGVPQLFCRLIGSNILVCLGTPAAPTIIASAVRVLPATGWVFIELAATFANTAIGSLTVQVDGQSVLNLNNIITTSDGTSIGNGILLGGRPSSNPYLFDDLYVGLSLLGPLRINTLFPVANVTTQFVPSANTNYQQINEPAMDGDTSYNFNATVGQADSFTMGNLTVSVVQILAVKIIIATRSDAESIRTIQTTMQSNLTVVGGTVQTLSNNYCYFSDVFLRDPNTKTPWTATGVRAARIGYRIVS
jgi:hypothetical protein